ncbi:hypothetical protein CR513_07593, partial [Mucuna pruriens]
MIGFYNKFKSLLDELNELQPLPRTIMKNVLLMSKPPSLTQNQCTPFDEVIIVGNLGTSNPSVMSTLDIHLTGISRGHVLDSGTSRNTPSTFFVERGEMLERPFQIVVPTRDIMLVKKMGAINLNKVVKLHNVLFVPGFSYNLIFVHKLTQDLNYIMT